MVTTLLLAAGLSRRFGSNKLLASLDEGRPLVVATASALIAADCRILAVLHPEAREVASLLSRLPQVAVTSCPRAYLGMGHSLAWGVSRSAEASGWLIALGDMPFIQPGSIRAVAERLEQGASIIAPIFRGRRGHPVGFSNRWRRDLLELKGEAGGAPIIRRNASSLELVPCSDPGVLRDVDSPSDVNGWPAVGRSSLGGG